MKLLCSSVQLMLCRQSIIGVFLLIFLFSGTAISQTTYYIDAENGSDANNGRSEATAWKTISKFSSNGGYVSGDVISFKRGQTHFGRIVPSTSGLTFNAYGNGNRPLISGAVVLNTWTSIGGGVYETSIAAAPKILMINGRKYSKGKYPDNGWMNIDNTSGGNITSNDLAGRNFSGAKAVIRKNRWIIDNDSITSQGGNTIYFSYKFYAPKQNYKFFITDHLACLSQFGEWYYDHAARKLRVFFGTNNPSAVTASISDNVITLRNVNNTKVSELAFAFANQDIVYMSSTDNTRFSNCTFEYGYNAFGFWAGANTNANISSCTIRFMNNNGCYIAESGNNNGFVLDKNDFHQIGAIPGEGGNGDGTYTAINMGGGYPDFGPSSNARISNNTIDTVGYVGVMGGAQNLLITNNIISQYCFIKDDGGAIYGATIAPNKKISGNIILNGAVKAWEGSDNQNNYAYGLYMDNNSQNVILENNTVANGVVGIFLHDAQNITVQGNTIFNMLDKSIMVWKTGLGQNPVSNIIIRDNIAVNIKQDSRTLDVQNLKQDGTNIANWGSFDLNYYCRPLNETKTIYTGGGSGNFYTLNEWQALHGHDKNSKKSPKTFPSNINPNDSIKFVYNPSNSQQATSLNGTYIDAKNNQYVSSITLAPFSSAVLFVNSAVTAIPNQTPQANAGKDQIITLPTNSVTLNGSGVDADGTITSHEWRKISGPNGDVIDKAAAVATLITGLMAGIYVYRLTVTDNKGATSYDDVQITVNNAPAPPVDNTSPTVNAGQDISIALPVNTVTLKGNATDSDGTVATYVWTKISGPAGGDLQSANAVSTNVTGLIAGTYVFRLTVKDNAGAEATDDIQVIVTAAPPPVDNTSPTVNAGQDITIALPVNTVTLKGNATDSDGTVATYVWTKISGPAGGDLQSANAVSTNVTGLIAGTYVFRLTVKDNAGAEASDDVQVIVTAAPPVDNNFPTVNAGQDIVIDLPENTVTLKGSAADSDGSVASYVWTKISGPAGGNLQSANAASTLVTGLNAGTYVFRLTVKDNAGAEATDDIQVIVTAAPPPVDNNAPTVNAGQDIAITSPESSVTLKGSAADSDGSVASYVWTKIAGPAGGNLQSANTASTLVTGLNAGTYVFRLTVTDNGGAIATDDVSVQVNTSLAPSPSNQAPISNAGNDINITLPANSATLTGTGTDADGSVSSYAWSKVSGPTGGNIQSNKTASTNITGLTTGTYIFRLTVTDNAGAESTDDVQVIVTAAPPVAGNQAPTANAGNNQSVTLPVNTVTLSGSGNDTDGSITSFAWVKVSGPAGGNVQAPSAANTEISGLVEGTYTYRLTVTDNTGATATDDVQVSVNAAAVLPNAAPNANAGRDVSITLPTNSVTLNGTASTDPDGSIVSYVWRKVQGPAGSSFTSTNIASPVVNGLARGQYEFELTITDNRGATSTDRVLVTVLKVNQRPVARLRRDTIKIVIPVQNTELSGLDSYDPDGLITSYDWTYKSGPREPKILSPQSAKTIVADLVAGTYEFNLHVTDDDGEKDNKAVVVIVKNSSSRRLIPDVSVYPNPATSMVNIKIISDVEGRTTLTFIDIKGRPVMTDVFVKGYGSYTRQVNIGRLPKGTYSVLIQVDQTEKVVEKLIKF